MDAWHKSPRVQFVLALLISSLVSVGLYMYGSWRGDASSYGYLMWNLFLAWLPLLFAVRLTMVLRRKLWSSWEALAWSALWLLFLPNSFYMVSDFIHLREVSNENVLYDAVMFTSFINTALVIGFASLALMHAQMRKRFKARVSALWVGVTLFLCSIAIYVGRDLRWNSWDILTNPGGLLLSVSDRFRSPDSYPDMLITIAIFFVLLASMYNILWRAAKVVIEARHLREKSTDAGIY